MTQDKLTYFEVASGKIDRRKGVIRGCAVITVGEAKGHGMRVDMTTLEQVMDCAADYVGGLAVRFADEDHGGGAANIVGNLRNFQMGSLDERHMGDAQGQIPCLRADLQLLKAHADYPLILEMAETMPESFGLSIMFSGVHEEKDGERFARCAELYGCDIVKNPAANPTGLFSKPDIQPTSEQETIMATNKNLEVEFAQTSAALKDAEVKLTAFTEQVKTLTAERDELKAKHEALTAEQTKQAEALQASALEINVLKDATVKSAEAYKALEESFAGRIAAELAKVGQPPVDLNKAGAVEDDFSKLSIGELAAMSLKVADESKRADFYKKWIAPKLK
jgi:hypothetical protein